MKSVEEIVDLYRERLEAQGPILNQMREVRRLANGDVVVPLNELDRSARSSVANLLVQGLDQMSMRVASTMPSPYFPAMREGQDRSMALAYLHIATRLFSLSLTLISASLNGSYATH